MREKSQGRSNRKTVLIFASAIIAGIVLIVFFVKSQMASPITLLADKAVRRDPAQKMADLASWYDTVLSAGKECEKVFSEIPSQETPLDSYEHAKLAEWTCHEGWVAGKAIERSARISYAGQKSADLVIKYCSNASLNRKIAAGKLMVVFDGDVRPSAISASNSAMRDVKSAADACTATGVQLAYDEGVNADEFTRLVSSK